MALAHRYIGSELDVTEIEHDVNMETEHSLPIQATVGAESIPGLTMSYNRVLAAQSTFSDILRTFGLSEYYPSKISLSDVTVIKKATGHLQLVDLPWMIIQKVLMLDAHVRDQFYTALKQPEGKEGAAGGSLDDFLYGPQSSYKDEDDVTHFNTLDVLVTIFTCCDNFLKQTLAQKMFVCKLAIPFLYPVGSEYKIMMSLWALRTITLQCHSRDGETTERLVTTARFPLVTFVRLGRPPLSKSKLMNDILTEESHNAFFNCDCTNGNVKRKLTDGLVECLWFVTGGKEKEHLPGTTMFLNLRGDASSARKQLEILLEMSSVVFVIVAAQDLVRDQNTSTCQKILQADAKTILLLITGGNKRSTQELRIERQTCVEAVGKNLLQHSLIISSCNYQGMQKNASELKIEARKYLSKTIVEIPVGMTIEEFAQKAEQKGIMIDEFEDRACLEGKALAENIVNHMKDKNNIECKEILLPLQGKGWIEYCKLQKKQFRASGNVSQLSTAEYVDRIQEEMDHLRKNQAKIWFEQMSPFMRDFISGLQHGNQYIVLHFLQWIKLLLDEKPRVNLPLLHKQYLDLKRKFRQARKEMDNTKLQELTAQMEEAERHIDSPSLGLENLFRELGQIYESVKWIVPLRNNIKLFVEYLPEIAAKMLMKGIPLELVDGDTSSVPLSWVRAVLKKLENIIGDERLFVLSVLGIQSSGKSTLLNTMFGLQFGVSAGRCTRGAHMQLIAVDDNAGLPFRYIIVVDTEGLRAPELGKSKYVHDNELATLVTGLGDVTMINIKGENIAEMSDILQIVVHAFLRMNLVNKHIKARKSCIFVHQNVPAANAIELTMHGWQKLQESLDYMAKEAAHSENIADINCFSDIINFDVQRHVWYFSDLWQGDPPMAPANPGYSKKVEEVRLSLLEDIAKSQTTFLTTSDLSLRLKDLWNGVLAEDFVFSFRNSLEVKAYNNLQSIYYGLEWKMQNELRNWLQKGENKLNMCETIDDLDTTFYCLYVEFSKVLEEKYAAIKDLLQNYIKTNNLREIIIQWKQSKLNQLKLAVQQQKAEGKTDLNSVKESRTLHILQTNKWAEYEVYIMEKAFNLADKLKGKEVTDAELEDKFNAMWMPMMHALATKSNYRELHLDLEMEQILYQRLQAHTKCLRNELKHNPLDVPLQQLSLNGSITLDDVKKDYISLKTQSGLQECSALGEFPEGHELQARKETVLLTENILQEVSMILKNICICDKQFKRAHAIEVIQKVVDKLETHNRHAHESSDCSFEIRPEYIVKLAVHVSRHCVQIFSSMQFEYDKKHGIDNVLKDYKKTAWSLFKNMVKQRTDEVIAGDLLCTKMRSIVETAVKKDIPRKCIDEVLRDFQMTKYYLIVKILDDLACKGEFEEYRSYIESAKEFALRWISQYTDEKMFSKQDESDMSRYAKIAESHIGRIIDCIVNSVVHATDEVEKNRDAGMSLWMKNFCAGVAQEIALPPTALKHVRVQHVKNFGNLQRIIIDQLEQNVKPDLVKAFANETKESVDWFGVNPYHQILDKLWGCPEQCPFCKEPCADTTPDHYSSTGRSHMCVQHRPVGIGGGKWEKEDIINGMPVHGLQLIHETCNYIIQLEKVYFQCEACQFKCRDNGKCKTKRKKSVNHMCREYKTYLPSWDIAPDPVNNVSKYWMWFMITFQSQLKDMHNSRLPTLPGSWSMITREEALNDLRKIHN